MRYLKQFGLILAVTFGGEIFKRVLPFPIPANIYGLALMLLLLLLKVIPLESVESGADFLIAAMPVMFIPPVVEIMVSWDQVAPLMVSVLVISVLTTVAVMVVTGKVTDLVIALMGKEKEDE